ncbi:uncharacterized protein N0V89_003591 [Didymosphaeria variabile]|uniref:lytic cellulose monooxygenase (C4-dehydrogenating) n=1 Tax=Didymosphaeria variabile TaxID=1932322 RepID=A0A9W9CCV2_9PLEO|nr:uncharacterized protein N0V89_003591 [Didymosphaeria variabile]KAJ4355571.1 hypothetical protein N0V89_003591 [Didymosphaeria variabile]
MVPSTTKKFAPNWDYSGEAAMCGENGTLPLFPVKTLKVAAGSTIGFAVAGQSRLSSDESKDMSDFDPSFYMYHPGPATAWLSKAPDSVDLNEYKGDGDWWVDFFPLVLRTKGAFMNFTIPAATPPGKYLLRAEHLNMENGGFYKTTEMYQACAHVEITGSGTDWTGTPGPVTHFPGAFDAKDPGKLGLKLAASDWMLMQEGIWLPQALFRPYQPMEELKNWQGAGPKVWRDTTRLDTLPTEIIRNVLSFLKEDTPAIYDEEAETNESVFQDWFRWDSKNYRSAALVNKGLGVWSQELLVESAMICETPGAYIWGSWRSTLRASPLALFVRTLFDRPDLGPKVRQLTVLIPSQSCAKEMALYNLEEGKPAHNILSRAAAHIKTLGIPRRLRISWTKKLRAQYPYCLIGIILTLVPNVRHVAFVLDTESFKDDGIDFLCTFFGTRPTKAHHLAYFHRLGALRSVKSLIIRGPSPVALTGLEYFPGIQDLHLRLEFRPNRRAGLTPATISSVQFRNVSRLRLDIQLVPKPGRLDRTHPTGYFGPLLAAFENLMHLDLSDGPRDNNRNYAYASAELILLHLNDLSRLVSLKMPRKIAGPELESTTMAMLTSLKTLTAPFRAIVNEDLDTFKSLPQSLQHLILHDAVFDTIPCVQDLMQEKATGESMADMTRIEMWFAESFTDKSLERLRKGTMFPSLEEIASEVKVRLIIGKIDRED